MASPLSQEQVRKKLKDKIKVIESFGENGQPLSQVEAETRDKQIKASLRRAENLQKGVITAEDIKNKELAVKEAETLLMQNLLDATPKTTSLEAQQSTQTGQAISEQPPQNAQGQVLTPAQQIEQQSKQNVNQATGGLLGNILDPLRPENKGLAGIPSRLSQSFLNKTGENSKLRPLAEQLHSFVQTQRFTVRKLTQNLVGIRVAGIGIGTERENDLRTKLTDSRRVLNENAEKMGKLPDAVAKGEITADEAAIQYKRMRDQVFEMERGVLEASKDPLAFKLGDMQDDLADFTNFREVTAPITARQLARASVAF